MSRITSLAFLISGLICWLACQSATKVQPPDWLARFPAFPPGDTFHIEIREDNAPEGDTIPNSLFFTRVPKALLEPIDYLADSAQAVVISRQQFPIDDRYTAYWVEIRQFWFQHHSLFLYDASQKTFTDRVTVAEWYGGEGGQVLLGSWVFDFDGDGKKDIVVREIQHSITPNNEAEPIERIDESAVLWLWKNGRFEEAPSIDTATLVQRYPIKHFW